MKKTILLFCLLLTLALVCLGACGDLSSSGDSSALAQPTVDEDNAGTSEDTELIKDTQTETDKEYKVPEEANVSDAENTTSTTSSQSSASQSSASQSSASQSSASQSSASQPSASQPSALQPSDMEPVSAQPAANAILHVYGEGVSQDCWFTLAELQGLSGQVEAEYFYRGKDPDQGHSKCKGVKLSSVLNAAGLADGAAKAIVRAGDGYGVSYTLNNIRKAYIDETDAAKSLYMILAWYCDGKNQDMLTLVLGQNIEGEYNRTYWVKNVTEVEVIF